MSSSIQVIVYPQPQHFVRAPGTLYYYRGTANDPQLVKGTLGTVAATSNVGGFSTRVDESPALGIISETAAVGSLSPQVGESPSLGNVFTTAAIQPLSSLLLAPFNGAATTSNPEPFVGGLGISLTAAPSVAASSSFTAQQSQAILPPVSVTGALGALGILVAIAPEASVGQAAPLGPLLLPGLTGVASTTAINPLGELVILTPGSSSAQVGLFAQQAPLFSAAALAAIGSAFGTQDNVIFGFVVGTTAINVFSAANFQPAESTIPAIVFPQPKHNIAGWLYYRGAVDARAVTSAGLPFVATAGAAAAFTPGLIGIVAVAGVNSVSTEIDAPLSSAAMISATAPLSELALFNLSISSTGAAGSFFSVGAPLLPVSMTAAVEILGLSKILLLPASAIATAGQFAIGIFPVTAIGTENAFGPALLLGSGVGVGAVKPAAFTEVDANLGTVFSQGNARLLSGAQLIVLSPTQALGAQAPLTESLVGQLGAISSLGQTEPLSSSDLVSVPLGSVAALGRFGLIAPTIGGTLAGISAIGQQQSLTPGANIPVLPSAAMVANIKPIVGGAEILPLPPVFSFGQVGAVSLPSQLLNFAAAQSAASVLMPAQRIGAGVAKGGFAGLGVSPLAVFAIGLALSLGRSIVIPLPPPAPPPFYPLGRGRLGGGIRVARVSRVR